MLLVLEVSGPGVSTWLVCFFVFQAVRFHFGATPPPHVHFPGRVFFCWTVLPPRTPWIVNQWSPGPFGSVLPALLEKFPLGSVGPASRCVRCRKYAQAFSSKNSLHLDGDCPLLFGTAFFFHSSSTCSPLFTVANFVSFLFVPPLPVIFSPRKSLWLVLMVFSLPLGALKR